MYNADNTVKQRFEYGLSHTPVSFTQSGQRYYIQTDHLGSPRVISNSSGVVVKAINYDSYGNVISDSNPDITIPFGFAGGLYDADTGLIRFGHRDYDPETGRWTARDPIGFGGGLNHYAYVGGNPVGFVDPSGLAQFGVRPLGNGTDSFEEGSDPLLWGNVKFAHEQLWFDDEPNENIGYFSVGPKYGKSGIVRHDYGHERSQYKMLPGVYNDYYMRLAVDNISYRWDQSEYRLTGNNCQDFADALRDEYWRLVADVPLGVEVEHTVVKPE